MSGRVLDLAAIKKEWGWFGIPRRARQNVTVMLCEISWRDAVKPDGTPKLAPLEGFPSLWWRWPEGGEGYWPRPTAGVEIISVGHAGDQRAFRIVR